MHVNARKCVRVRVVMPSKAPRCPLLFAFILLETQEVISTSQAVLLRFVRFCATLKATVTGCISKQAIVTFRFSP